MSRRRPTFDLLAVRRCPWSSPSGVRGAARTHGLVRNRRGPSSQPCQQDRSYKPMVKSSGGKRESDGVVVPMIAARNAAGGKDPDFGHAGHRGKRRDMTETARSNHPDGYTPVANVRQLQNWLWATAKQSPCPVVLSMTPGAVTSHLVAVAPADEKAA
jgi:hypothetical protein